MIRIAICIANKTDTQIISNFHDETSKMNRIMHAKRQKQTDEMFCLSRRVIFNNSQLGSQTYEIIGFFPARIRNITQLIRWMEFLSQKNRLSNWSGARHSGAFWELSRAWKWLRFHSELGRIVGKTRTSERIVEMSGIARLTKSTCCHPKPGHLQSNTFPNSYLQSNPFPLLF